MKNILVLPFSGHFKYFLRPKGRDNFAIAERTLLPYSVLEAIETSWAPEKIAKSRRLSSISFLLVFVDDVHRFKKDKAVSQWSHVYDQECDSFKSR